MWRMRCEEEMSRRIRSGAAGKASAQALEVPIELTRSRLESMRRAAAAVLECEREVRGRVSNIVAEVLRGSDAFYEYEHYPDSDVFDPSSHSQYYYHAHRGSFLEYGHFHLFMRQNGMPPDMTPAALPGKSRKRKRGDSLCHLIAISMDAYGTPMRLFTVNRWVTDEMWYDAPDVIRLLDKFAIDPAIAPAPVNRWIGAMVQLFWPQITVLLEHRDRVIADWRAQNPRRHALEDRRLEISSYLEISVEAQINSVSRALAAAGTDPKPAQNATSRAALGTSRRVRRCRTAAHGI